MPLEALEGVGDFLDRLEIVWGQNFSFHDRKVNFNLI